MDFQFFNWLLNAIASFLKSIFKDKQPEVVSGAIGVTVPLSRDEALLQLADQVGLNRAPIRRLTAYWGETFKGKTPRFWAVFDATKHSSMKRLYIFDVAQKTVTTYYVAHGKNSDPSFTGFCKSFSNTNGSLQTSKGIYRCAETYISGKFGYAMRLEGLESSNNNARARAIVFHGANYVSDKYVKENGKCGRSEGCTAVDFKYSKELIDKLKNGSPLIIWAGEGVSDEKPVPPPPNFPVSYRTALSWENTTEPHPERAAWSDEIMKTLDSDYDLYEQAVDFKELIPNAAFASMGTKLKALGEFWVALAFFESGFDPKSSSVDVGEKADRNSYSDGLYQMSGNDSAAKLFGYDYKDLLEPIPNIRTAMEQMRRQLRNGNQIFLPNSSKYRYWAVALRGNKYSQIEKIKERVWKHTPGAK